MSENSEKTRLANKWLSDQMYRMGVKSLFYLSADQTKILQDAFLEEFSIVNEKLTGRWFEFLAFSRSGQVSVSPALFKSEPTSPVDKYTVKDTTVSATSKQNAKYGRYYRFTDRVKTRQWLQTCILGPK